MPALTLSRKIFLALATLLIAMLLIFTGLSVFGLQAGLGSYAAEIEIRRMDWLAQLLQRHYAARGNWKTLREDTRAWQRLRVGQIGWSESDPFAPSSGSAAADGAPVRRLPPWYAGPLRGEGDGAALAGPGDYPPPFFALLPFGAGFNPREAVDAIYRRLAVVDAAGALVAGATVDRESAARLPLRQGTAIIGYLMLAPMEGLGDQAGRAFLARQSRFLAVTGLAGLMLALVLSWLLARRWFAPIDELATAARNIARGRLATRVQVRGSDEFAVLARTFNHMAQRLDTISASRRAWLADVAHELRTPLAAMRAEIEALQDGVRSFDDRTALRLHRQVMRLSQLVDDLRSSMRSEEAAATPAPVYPLAVLADALALTQERFAQQRITVDRQQLDAVVAQRQPVVQGDADRLHQVFINLLENTLSYTDAGGLLQIGARVEDAVGGPQLLLQFDDSAPGVNADDLPRVFERLFRCEASRNRDLGGSGLGLSICRALVEEHVGSIEASASPLGGLRITIVLPMAESA